MIRARAGSSRDDVAFDAIFEDHAADAMSLAGMLVGDRRIAEDVVADAFAKTFVRWRRGVVEDPWPYLRRAIINEVRGTWRRRVRRPEGQMPADVQGIDAPVSVEDRDELHRALLALPVRQRTAVVLRYLEDLSERNTAAAMGCSLGTVKSATARGLERLRVALEER